MSTRVTDRLQREDRLWVFFDTGAFGSRPLVGTVKKSGPKQALIEWESGIRNRLSWEWVKANAFNYNGEFENG